MKKILLLVVVFVSNYAFSMNEGGVSVFPMCYEPRKEHVDTLLELYGESVKEILGGDEKSRREIVLEALLGGGGSLERGADLLGSWLENPEALINYWNRKVV
ncbi:MAG: hypothetical protein LBJ96_04895 [Holosporaceae bacterium]|nr:hypothetical protein [Holosporaceae bacterium]